MRLALCAGPAAVLLLIPAAAAAQVQTQYQLTGDETPSSQPWTQPASLSWMESSEDDEDRLAVDAALKVSHAFASRTGGFVRGVAHVSDQSKKQQETYSLQAGLTHDATFGGRRDEQGALHGALSLYTDVYLGWNSKATFGDPTTAACVAAPTAPACGTQHQKSYRLSLDLQPFMESWERTYAVEQAPDGTSRTTGDWAYSFAPRLVVFHDEVTEAVLNAAGQEEDGAVSGARLMFSFAVSPPVFDHRLIFRTSLQHMQAFHRSEEREPSFDASTSLAKVSLDYEFGARSWEKAGWAPSIGLAYSSGEDPLEGRKDKDDVSVALRLTYRSGS
jgi:hypothetical protein